MLRMNEKKKEKGDRRYGREIQPSRGDVVFPKAQKRKRLSLETEKTHPTTEKGKRRKLIRKKSGS